jgi:hypothetical protein
MRCHACGGEIALGPGERVGFRDECPRCRADLHACRGCAHYEPGAYNECRETSAERVLDKERANRCEWFAPAADGGGAGEAVSPRSQLERLFKK